MVLIMGRVENTIKKFSTQLTDIIVVVKLMFLKI